MTNTHGAIRALRAPGTFRFFVSTAILGMLLFLAVCSAWGQNPPGLATRIKSGSSLLGTPCNSSGGNTDFYIQTGTGVFYCKSGAWQQLQDAGAAAGVTSFSGDGTLITNSSSTGAVTVVLGNAGAHKFWGNNTGSTAPPNYYQPAFTDLSGSASCSQLPALTGSVTTSAGSCATTLETADIRRTCSIVAGSDNGGVLVDSDLGAQGGQCYVPAAGTIVEITVKADGGTPSVQVRKEHGGTNTNILSAALATASSGGIACALTSTSGTCIDGTTSSSSITLSTTSLSAGDWIGLTSGTAGGTAKRMSIAITWTVTQ